KPPLLRNPGPGVFMAIEDLWYKNAIIYCLSVEKYMDSNADGVGDFEGLSRRLPYLSGLGVTCVWLQPFYVSPFRDNGHARQDYFHRFYDFQPDLNTSNKTVRDEITKIMGFWLELGVSGFRMDAVPFLIRRKGPDVEHVQDFELLHDLRHFLQWRSGEAIL